MRMKVLEIRFFLVSALVIVLTWFTVSPSAGQTDVSGTWDLRVKTQQGTATPSITLRQRGEEITGSYNGKMGKVDLTGTLRGNNIEFTVRLKFREMPFVITYSGRVDGDAMQGTARFGDAGSGEWTGKRRITLRGASAILTVLFSAAEARQANTALKL